MLALLNCITQKHWVKAWTDSTGSGQNPLVGYCEDGNEFSGAMKGENFFSAPP
jgi:hypothetical protein